MKLKGEKELIAEELYNSMDEELYDITVKANLDISKIDITDYNNFLDNMYNKAYDIVLYREITNAIYDMDLEVFESKALLKLSKDRKLIIKLKDIVDKHSKLGINIYNKDNMKYVIHIILSGIIINENGD